MDKQDKIKNYMRKAELNERLYYIIISTLMLLLGVLFLYYLGNTLYSTGRNLVEKNSGISLCITDPESTE